MSKAYEVAVKIVQAEVAAKRAAEQAPKPVKPRTKIVQLPYQRIENSRDVVNQAGSGTLKEFKIKSPTDAFNVEVMWEKGTIKGSYTELAEKAACYEEDGSYFLHITDVEFTEYLIVVVSVEEPTTFNLIYAQLMLKER